jgi:hypothetical protein
MSSDAGAVGTRENELEPIFQSIVPADGIMLPIGESGDFGSSPFFGQLIGRAASACLHPVRGVPDPKHNSGPRINRAAAIDA